jgi:hypothetical protein
MFTVYWSGDNRMSIVSNLFQCCDWGVLWRSSRHQKFPLLFSLARYSSNLGFWSMPTTSEDDLSSGPLFKSVRPYLVWGRDLEKYSGGLRTLNLLLFFFPTGVGIAGSYFFFQSSSSRPCSPPTPPSPAGHGFCPWKCRKYGNNTSTLTKWHCFCAIYIAKPYDVSVIGVVAGTNL